MSIIYISIINLIPMYFCFTVFIIYLSIFVGIVSVSATNIGNEYRNSFLFILFVHRAFKPPTFIYISQCQYLYAIDICGPMTTQNISSWQPDQ